LQLHQQQVNLLGRQCVGTKVFDKLSHDIVISQYIPIGELTGKAECKPHRHIFVYAGMKLNIPVDAAITGSNIDDFNVI